MLNKAGRTLTIFIVLIIVLLVSSTSIGFYLYHVEERLNKKTQADLDTSHASELHLQAEVKDLQTQLNLEEDKNKEDDAKINNLLDEQDLNEGLRTALKKENAGLKEQIGSLDQARDKMKSDLDDATTKLAQYQQLLKSSDDKSKELESHLATLAQNNKDLQAKLENLKSQMQPYDQRTPDQQIANEVIPPSQANDKIQLDKIVVNPQNGTQGHILSVDTDAEFVVFNLGMKQGVKPDDVLSVYRGQDYLGDIKATRVQDEMSAADIIPPLSAQEIRKNDTVILKP